MKRIITWVCILALIITLAGCSKGNSNPQEDNSVITNDISNTSGTVGTKNEINNLAPIIGVGSYVEHEMKQPERQQGERSFGYRLNSNNQYEIFTYVKEKDKTCNKVYCYTYDGDSFQKSSLEWAVNACKELNVIPLHFAYSEDGNEYMIFIKTTLIDGKSIESCMLLTKEGTNGYRDITPSYWKDGTNMMPNFSGSYVDNIRVTKNQILCYRDYDGLELIFYDLKTGKMIDSDIHSNRNIGDVILRDNIVYYMRYDEWSIEIYDMDQDTVKSIPLPSSDASILEIHIEVGPDNEILFLDRKGIHILKEETGTWEMIVDGSQSTLSVPSYYASPIVAMPGTDTTYFIEYNEDLVVKYERYKDGTIIYEKELTICSLYENTSIREAISYYRRKHPEVKINYNVLTGEAYGVAKTDTINTLNTELLAGNGADIIIMDDLPLSDYIEKGVLMDISDIFIKASGEHILLQNVSDCYTRDGEIFCMPMRVFLPCYGMQEDILNYTKTVEDLATYCEGKELKLMEPYRYDKLVRFFLINYSNEIFSEDGLIDEERLSSFLSSIDIIAKQIGSDAESNGGYLEDNSINTRLIDKYLGYLDVLLWEDYVMLSTDTIGSNVSCEHLIAILNHINGTFGSINDTFYPNGIVGINQQTKEPELARDFVSSLFEETMQIKDLADGFPVNENALNNWIKPGDSRDSEAYWTREFALEEIPFLGLTKDDMQKVVTMVKSTTRPAYTDDSGCTIIVEGAVAYLKGEKTLEQAVDEISRKVNLYQSE